jgi:hypothetical protein
VSHESHHLGMRSTTPSGLSPADAMAYQVLALCVAEGMATYFISGPPPGRAPALPEARFHVFTPDLAKVWTDRVAGEEEMVQRQTALLDKALAGELTQNEFDTELRDYWLNGVVGRAGLVTSIVPSWSDRPITTALCCTSSGRNWDRDCWPRNPQNRSSEPCGKTRRGSLGVLCSSRN